MIAWTERPGHRLRRHAEALRLLDVPEIRPVAERALATLRTD
jgi:hypothetical protein